jgi:hypothetical protein
MQQRSPANGAGEFAIANRKRFFLFVISWWHLWWQHAMSAEVLQGGAYQDAPDSLLLSPLAAICVQVAAAERTAEVWVQLAAELGASPEQLAAVRASTGSNSDLLQTAAQPPLL